MIADWSARTKAEGLRQWPIIVYVAERVAEMPEFDGLMLLGSFASGRCDNVSDVDFVAVARDGEFSKAWERRRELETPGTLFQWDVLTDEDEGAGGHKWMTLDIVKVECSIVDASRGSMERAKPFAVIVGDPSIADRFPPLEPIPSDVLEAYAQELREKGLVPEVEMRYGDLRDALRRAMRGAHS